MVISQKLRVSREILDSFEMGAAFFPLNLGSEFRPGRCLRCMYVGGGAVYPSHPIRVGLDPSVLILGTSSFVFVNLMILTPTNQYTLLKEEE
jgi:hypothetical protein